MEYITLNESGYAQESGFIKCHVTNINGEYIGERDEYISVNTGLPGGSFIDAPPASTDGMAIVRIRDGWELVEDHRGEAVFSTDKGTKTIIDYLGPIAAGNITIAPATPYDTWNGTSWVTDSVALNKAKREEVKQQKQILLTQATNYIAPLIDAKEGGFIEDSDLTVLIAWQKYRYALTKVDLDNPVWPEKPE